MLKSELENQLKEAEAKAEDYRNDIMRLLRETKDKDEEIKELNGQLDYLSNQMQQISQSVYTVLKIKYPYIERPELGLTENPIDCDERRFLEFIHSLCVDRNYGKSPYDTFGL